MTTPEDVARAFSGHRFEEAFGHLADDVRWVLVGQAVVSGRDAVVAACRATTDELVGVTTTFSRFVSVAADDVAVVDVVAAYDGPDGLTGVSSCDIYEFAGDLVRAITSYTVEVDPGDPGAPPAENQPGEANPPVPDAPAGPTDPPADPDEPLNPA